MLDIPCGGVAFHGPRPEHELHYVAADLWIDFAGTDL